MLRFQTSRWWKTTDLWRLSGEIIAPAARLEDNGARAVYKGRRYVRVPDCKFYVCAKLKSIDRSYRLSLGDESSDVSGVATFEGHQRIKMMGRHYRAADILVVFTTLEHYEREKWHISNEHMKRWPCRLDYEADAHTGVVRWRLVLDLPADEIERIVEISTTMGVYGLSLSISLGGL